MLKAELAGGTRWAARRSDACARLPVHELLQLTEYRPHQELKRKHVTVLTPHAYECGQEVINLLEKETAGDDGQKNM